MSRDSTVIAFRQPEAIDDPLSELAREGDGALFKRRLGKVRPSEPDPALALGRGLRRLSQVMTPLQTETSEGRTH
jgi:putative transposase